ncbi:RNA polymerase sigma-70 factor (ECF subfamily) [Actinocorallia herbida]|uniref:RNA polymerase sigma-70 factor (ECF subfamily) n=1 Tax=Actinocorallia herbida TaxID=58109 RepID=A0A3N1CTZ3_9ACTN|nr:RNA polymerase sigma factor SigJ [Actinocorallia herbida]ROO84777.1 RNA polymerase sigma-70 factor (ECF subfamily) [Actinocorallia herbida]
MTSPESARPVADERRGLLDLGYRMLGSVHDAEDVVQETYARWYALEESEREAIERPAAWLTRVASRICLDVLASARRRRERYTGEWLPEPLPGAGTWTSAAPSGAADPAERITLDESVAMGMLVVLDAVTPAERVSFILHDVFGVPFAEIAEAVGRSPASCRQLAASARRRLARERPALTPAEDGARVIAAFKAACLTGDLDSLTALLDPAVTARSDGGGKVSAARRPVIGADRVARFLLGILRKVHAIAPTATLTETTVNGRPGAAITVDGTVHGVVSAEITSGHITQLWIILNPDKLTPWNNPHKPPPR